MTAERQTTDRLREALRALVVASCEVNNSEPDRGDGDPLEPIDDALIAVADALGLPTHIDPDAFRAALSAPEPKDRPTCYGKSDDRHLCAVHEGGRLDGTASNRTCTVAREDSR